MEKLPFFVLSGLVAVSTIVAQRHVGAIVDMGNMPLGGRILMVFRSLVLYLWQVVFPVHLLPLYPYPDDISMHNWQFPAAIAVVIVLTAACVLKVNNNRLWLAAWIVFIAALFPVLGLLQSGPQPMADRYIYVAAIAPFFLIGLGVTRGYRSLISQRGKVVASLVGLFFAALLGWLTVQQTGIWKDNLTLWTRAIDEEPGRLAIAYHNRGLAMTEAGRYDEAIADATHAVTVDPEYHDAYHNRGNALAGKGDYGRAVIDYRKALTLKPTDPVIYSGLGLALAALGQYDDALDAYNRALALRPDFGDVFNNRGLAYVERGNIERGLADFARAGELKPDDPKVHVNMGIAFAAAGKGDQAEKEYAAALALRPGSEVAANALSNRGVLRFNRKDYDGALADFDAAAELAPNSVAVFNNRAALYRFRRDFRRAAEDLTKVVALNPALVKAYLDRGDAYLKEGDCSLAKRDFDTACRLGDSTGCSMLRSLR